MLRQNQQLRLSQKLSPQQIQLMKLLQIPTTQLEERIKEELEENPALEIDTIINKEDLFESTKEGQDDEYDQDKTVELEEVDAEKIEIDDYLKNEQDGSGDLGDDYYQSKDAQERSSIPVSVESSYQEVLLAYSRTFPTPRTACSWLEDQQVSPPYPYASSTVGTQSSH